MAMASWIAKRFKHSGVREKFDNFIVWCRCFVDVYHFYPSMLFTTTSRAASVVGVMLTEAYSLQQ